MIVNINFTSNLLLRFGRYCCKILPEPLFSPFLSACTHKKCFFNNFFTFTVVNNSRNNREPAFFLYFTGFGRIDFYVFIKISCF